MHGTAIMEHRYSGARGVVQYQDNKWGLIFWASDNETN